VYPPYASEAVIWPQTVAEPRPWWELSDVACAMVEATASQI
jgi:hypothetical protein